MVKLIALKEIVSDGRIIGFKIKIDGQNEVRDLKTEAIIKVVNSGQAVAPNLGFVNGQLRIISKASDVSGKTSENTDMAKNTMPSKTVHEHVQNKPSVQNSVQQSKIVQQKVQAQSINSTAGSASKSDTARLKELVVLLNKARMVYEQGKDEIMSNFEYDKLYSELEALEKKTGIVMANSPTQNVGYEELGKVPKEKHATPMLSFERTKSRDELLSFLADKEGVLSWKLDGLTVVLTYNNGVLKKAVTRGNGTIGGLITDQAKYIKNIPHKIPYTGELVVRGEATIDYATFERVNSSLLPGEEPYKNARNLCSGSLTLKNPRVLADRNVMWHAFELVSADGKLPYVNFDDQLNWLKKLGFDCVEYICVSPRKTDSNFLLLALDYFEQHVKTYGIPSDGLVLTYRDRKYGFSLGHTAKAYKHSMAFKWQDEEAETKLLDIEWQVGRSGVVTPVAIYEPTDLEGSTIERASLHNLSVLAELLGQPYVGQNIKVYKANMIIPQISWAEKLGDTGKSEDEVQCIGIPGYCPCCGEQLEVRQEPDSGVYTLWCTNEDCSARGSSKFKHFVARDAMNIEGVSKSKIDALVDAGIVTDFVSIYHIKDHASEIMNLEGFGYTSFNNMVDAIEKSRVVEPCNFIFALGIPNVGLNTAKLICNTFNNNIEDIVDAKYNELIAIEGIGDTIASSFVEYFEDADNFNQVVALVKELKFKRPQANINSSMAGVTICVTGAVHIFNNRREVEDLIVKLGGKLTKSVSRSTSYLVTNDTGTGSRKNVAAAQYGIPVLTEQQFIDKFNLQQYI